MFEVLVIDWLKEASISAVSRLMGLSWSAIGGIIQRAVKRGLARRKEISPTRIGIDETVFKKRHDYVAVLSDQDAGTVPHVGSNRKKATLKAHGTKASQRRSEKRWICGQPLSMPH